MPLRLHQLNGSEAEVAAALRLQEVAGVLVRLGADDAAAEQLRRAGFVPMPVCIQAVKSLASSRPMNRARRRGIEASFDAWKTVQARLTLCRASELAPRVLDELYFGVFVPRLYARGWSPFGIHNHHGFRRLVGPKSWVGLVHCGDRLAGGALMKDVQIEGLCLAGQLPPGPGLLGQVYVLGEELAAARRAFLLELGAAVQERGFKVLSLGEDLPWMQRAYANVVLEKLAMADAVVFDDSGPTLWGHFDNFGENVLCFARTATGIELRAGPELSDVAGQLSRRILRLQMLA